MSRTRKDGLSILGVGAAACVACCAGPILAFFGGLSVVGVASTVFIGGAGIAIAVVAATAFLVLRRRRANNACAVDAPEPAPVSRRDARCRHRELRRSERGLHGEHMATTTLRGAKQVVRRLVDNVMNDSDVDLLDELCDPRLAPKLKLAFARAPSGGALSGRS